MSTTFHSDTDVNTFKSLLAKKKDWLLNLKYRNKLTLSLPYNSYVVSFREFGIGSTNDPLIDIFCYSHYLFV